MTKVAGFGHGTRNGIETLPNGHRKCLDCNTTVKQIADLASLPCGDGNVEHPTTRQAQDDHSGDHFDTRRLWL